MTIYIGTKDDIKHIARRGHRAMKSAPAFVCLLVVMMALSPDSWAICKWTDKDGTVHYQENCGDAENASRVEIEQPPSQQTFETSQQQAERARRASQVRDWQRTHEQQQQSAENNAVKNVRATMQKQCSAARSQLATLKEQLPVYKDENGALHTNRSWNNAVYEGPRQYLDEEQRAAEIKRFEKFEERACNTSEAEIRESVRSYTQNVNEDVCAQLKAKLAEAKEPGSGVASQDIQNLERVIKNQCR